MRELLSSAGKAEWSDTIQWLTFVLFGAVPFWGLALILWLFEQPIGANLLVQNAELVVYSAGLLASAIPIMQREIKGSPLKHPRWFLAVAVMVLVACGIVFATVALSERTTEEVGGPVLGWNLAGHRLLVVSITLASASLVLAFLTELINNIRLSPDIRGMRNREITSLGAAVQRRLREGSDE